MSIDIFFLNLSPLHTFLKFIFISVSAPSVADHNKESSFQLSTNIRDLIQLNKKTQKSPPKPQNKTKTQKSNSKTEFQPRNSECY